MTRETNIQFRLFRSFAVLCSGVLLSLTLVFPKIAAASFSISCTPTPDQINAVEVGQQAQIAIEISTNKTWSQLQVSYSGSVPGASISSSANNQSNEAAVFVSSSATTPVGTYPMGVTVTGTNIRGDGSIESESGSCSSGVAFTRYTTPYETPPPGNGPPGSCPAGYTDPHRECVDQSCQEVAGCGLNTCSNDNMCVLPEPPDFTISCSGTRTISQGDSASFLVTVTSINNFNQPVQLGANISPPVSSPPSTRFSPNPVIPTANSTLFLSTTAQTTPGQYFIIVYDASNYGGWNNQHSCAVNLRVTAAAVPTVDIKANGSDGPITIPLASAAVLTWSSTNAATCQVNPGNWTELQKPFPGQTTGALGAFTRYTITCTSASGQQVQDHVDINVSARPDFTLNCSPSGTQIIKQGESASFALSVGSQNGFNSQVSFSVQIAPVVTNPPGVIIAPNPVTPPSTSTLFAATTAATTPTDYSFTVTAQGGGLSHTCLLRLTVQKIDVYPTPGGGGGEPPKRPLLSVDNGQCGKIVLSWKPGEGALPSGYHLFRSATNTPYQWQQVGGDLPSSVLSYVDTNPLSTTGFNYYAVSAFNSNGESPKAISIPITVLACGFNVTLSDKDIISVNGIATGAQACNNRTDPVNVTSFNTNDLLTFQLNVCNLSGTTPANDVSVADTMENLSLEPGSARFTPGCDGDYSPKPLSGSSFSAQIKTIPAGSYCGVVVKARIKKPGGTPGAIFRFQNCGVISVNNAGAGTVCTSPFYFGLNDVPKRNEISP